MCVCVCVCVCGPGCTLLMCVCVFLCACWCACVYSCVGVCACLCARRRGILFLWFHWRASTIPTCVCACVFACTVCVPVSQANVFPKHEHNIPHKLTIFKYTSQSRTKPSAQNQTAHLSNNVQQVLQYPTVGFCFRYYFFNCCLVQFYLQ